MSPEPRSWDEDDCFPEPELIRCEVCGGTGLAVEGWDCEACEGEGGFEP